MIPHEFDLPVGYQDKDGQLHTRVTMRRPLTGDLIAVANDVDVREMAKTGRDIPIPTDGFDPIKVFVARAAVIHLRSVLFSQIVLRLGTITNPNRAVFRSLDMQDFEALEDQYDRLMEAKTPEDEANEQGGGDAPSPFAPGPSAS